MPDEDREDLFPWQPEDGEEPYHPLDREKPPPPKKVTKPHPEADGCGRWYDEPDIFAREGESR